METTLFLLRALANEKRIRILLALGQGELCRCHLTKIISVNDILIQHFRILEKAGLIDGRREGKFQYYSLAENLDKPMLSELMKWLSTFCHSDAIENDAREVAAVHQSAQPGLRLRCSPSNDDRATWPGPGHRSILP